jgi:sensor histidine kinase YesM
MDCQVLPGCLLTLIENALKHGFKGRRAPYQLIISAEEHGENLLLKVSDNGRGITSEYISELGIHPIKSEMKGGGVALYQLLRSMKMLFGDNVKISFESILNQGTTVSLRQPKRMIS